MKKDKFIEMFSQTLKNTTLSETTVGGKELLFYGISQEDLFLWKEMIEFGDDISIQNILKKHKFYLLTHVIGNPNDPLAKIMRNNSAHYGNIVLHDRIANSHDGSILKLEHLTEEQKNLLASNKKGTDYLLRYYELKQKKAQENREVKLQKIAEIEQSICAKDIEKKTPLLLACKTANQDYAIRLIHLDENKKI